MLDKQVFLHSIDTSSFYTEVEQEIGNSMQPLYFERSKLKKENASSKISEEAIDKNNERLKEIGVLLKEYKKELLELVSSNTNLRELNPKKLTDYSVVGMFESSLTRSLGCVQDEVTEDLFIIRVYYFGILEDILKKGFMYNGERYELLYASAGQLKKKMVVFVKSSSIAKVSDKLTCGLSLDKINSTVGDYDKEGNPIQGINVNKFLAYYALTNSSTRVWEGFDIDKTIVVDDFETNVEDEVDYLDWDEFTIERNVMEVPIPHTDGAGMILTGNKSFIFRAPWCKGLLTPFDYVGFIKEFGGNSKVKDIYGKEYDIIEDGIEIILTKSQFKMHKYFKSWDEYKANFKKYGCEMGICNEEMDRIGNSKISYQMLQTLYDMSDSDLRALAKKNIEDIVSIGNDVDKTLSIMGARNNSGTKNSLQEALNLYPALVQDGHCREMVKSKKKKLIKKSKAGKLKMDCKYTFVVPDMFAFCEWLFLGIENPKGLLQGREVSCSLFNDTKELDLLRSPHLYIEHGIRVNRVDSMTRKWYKSKAIVTSTHDTISRLLQFDVDGDTLLVNENSIMIENAKRIIKKHDVVPLVYPMFKALSEKVTANSLYENMIISYTGGNIGTISNAISKIFNGGDIGEEKMIMAKWLVSYNNFIIDHSKTRYKPSFPRDYQQQITSATNGKLPYFFKDAKDKEDGQVEKINGSVVNRLNDVIPNKRIKFDLDKFGRFDYNTLIGNKDIDIFSDLSSEIITLYTALDIRKPFVVNEYNKNYSQLRIVYKNIREKLLEVCDDEKIVCDVLVEYLYTNNQAKKKTTLWECFGEVIVENIKTNLGKEKESFCMKCGTHITKVSGNQKYCKSCSVEIGKKKSRERYQKMGNKTVVCKNDSCGKEFTVKATSRRLICDECSSKAKQKTKVLVCGDCGEEYEVSLKATSSIRCKSCKDKKHRDSMKEKMRKKRKSK